MEGRRQGDGELDELTDYPQSRRTYLQQEHALTEPALKRIKSAIIFPCVKRTPVGRDISALHIQYFSTSSSQLQEIPQGPL